MNFAPFGVFGAIAAVMATKGPAIFVFYGRYFLYFIIGIALLWMLLILVGYIILRRRTPVLLRRIVPAYHHCVQHHQQRSRFSKTYGRTGAVWLQQ